MSLKQRIQDPTPKWFKAIIKIALVLAAAGTAMLTAPGIHLPGFLQTAAQYMVVGGLVAAAVAKTAKEDCTPVVILMFTLAILTGCSRHSFPVTTEATISSDSTHEAVSFIKKDSTISRPGDTVKLHDTLPCPDAKYHKEVVSKSGRTKATVDLHDGKLDVECAADSLQARIEWLEAHEVKERFKTETRTITVTNTVNKKVVPWWCWLLSILIVAYAGIKLYVKIVSTPLTF